MEIDKVFKQAKILCVVLIVSIVVFTVLGIILKVKSL